MKIKIKAITQWDPNRGPVVLTHAQVEVASFRLGEECRGNLELGHEEPLPEGAAKDAVPRFRAVTNGVRTLTTEQLAEWKPSDGRQFARFIVLNAGLEAAE